MASNKSSADSRRATAQNEVPTIPEPTFRSAVYIGAAALIAVVCILIYGLINTH